MTEHVARCNSGADDKITARVDAGSLELRATKHGDRVMEAYVYPADARTFARGVLALADEIDGGEAKDKPATPAKWGTIKPGDKVRVLVDEAEFASVSVGDVFTVHKVDDRVVTVDDTDHGGYWYFRDTESIELVDAAPAEPDTDTTPARSSRAKYVDEARALLEDTYFDAEHLVKLAQFLAGGE